MEDLENCAFGPWNSSLVDLFQLDPDLLVVVSLSGPIRICGNVDINLPFFACWANQIHECLGSGNIIAFCVARCGTVKKNLTDGVTL